MAHEADARIARRLAPEFTRDCWIGLCVRVIEAGSHESRDAVMRTPDHYLAAAWAPVQRAPVRWPEAVVIGSPTASRAIATLLEHLPDDAVLFLAGVDDVDAALAASILLEADRSLEAYQREAVERFVHAEHDRMARAIASRYTDRDPAFERFRDAVVRGGDR
jgi:hypothetical protein